MARKREYISTVGRRKSAVAKVRLYTKDADTLNFTVNGKDYKDYFNYFEWQDAVCAPLRVSNRVRSMVTAKVRGGGVIAQAQALRLALARALILVDRELRSSLKKSGFLTVDARVKERKKPGLKRARRAPQWSKR